MRMTTQQKLDCLLRRFDELAESQGDGVTLSAQDIALLMEQCGFANRNEIGFYIRSLEGRGLVVADCSADNVILQASITIDGYCYLDSLNGH
ncbi:MAG: hypothetical protein OXC09_05795 [Truepera sp.]|nr:hypothetical protein [Truepera sp.]